MVDIYVGPSRTHWVLHAQLLRARSSRLLSGTKAGPVHLPDEDESTFARLVAWLYSARIPTPTSERDLGDLLELHALASRQGMPALTHAVLEAVRDFYRRTDSFPCLRRVQYVCAEGEDGDMRRLMVESVARMLVLGEEVPPHWERALRRDGAMAVDIIRAVQAWRLEPERVPDARWEGEEKGFSNGVGVNGVKAEEMAEGKRERSELDAAAAAPRDAERLANGWHH
jgi:hypothetical protein